jgi:hypothetical protein
LKLAVKSTSLDIISFKQMKEMLGLQVNKVCFISEFLFGLQMGGG